MAGDLDGAGSRWAQWSRTRLDREQAMSMMVRAIGLGSVLPGTDFDEPTWQRPAAGLTSAVPHRARRRSERAVAARVSGGRLT